MEPTDSGVVSLPINLKSGKPSDVTRVDRTMEILKQRTKFRESLIQRAHAAERDIDQWAIQAVQALMDDPNAMITLQPPRSIYDVESPF